MGAILAASTGIVGASVITMGLVSLPTMMRRGYDKRLITGTICASGTLGQIIPPSVILVLLGDIMGVSVGDLYIGAVLPGLLLVVPVHHLHRDPRSRSGPSWLPPFRTRSCGSSAARPSSG